MKSTVGTVTRRRPPSPPPVGADRIQDIYEWLAVTGEIPPHLTPTELPPVGAGAPPPTGSGGREHG